MKKVILIIIISGSLLLADDVFVREAFGVAIKGDTTAYYNWLRLAHDSLKLNTAGSGWINANFMSKWGQISKLDKYMKIHPPKRGAD